MLEALTLSFGITINAIINMAITLFFTLGLFDHIWLTSVIYTQGEAESMDKTPNI